MALRNYHNAHENKSLVSQRTRKLMWCQLVSEADHSLPFQKRREKKTEKGREERDRKIEGRRDEQDNAL